MSVSTRPGYTDVTRTPLPASSAPSASAEAPQGELARDLVAIPDTDVLTHGLRHLAMLQISDHRIAASLSGSWHELLAGRKPLPAGLFEHYLHEHPTPA